MAQSVRGRLGSGGRPVRVIGPRRRPSQMSRGAPSRADVAQEREPSHSVARGDRISSDPVFSSTTARRLRPESCSAREVRVGTARCPVANSRPPRHLLRSHRRPRPSGSHAPPAPRRRHSWGQVQCGHQASPHPRSSAGETGCGRVAPSRRGDGRERKGWRGGVAARYRSERHRRHGIPSDCRRPAGAGRPDRSVEPRAVDPTHSSIPSLTIYDGSPLPTATICDGSAAPGTTICDGSPNWADPSGRRLTLHPRAGRAPRRRPPGRAW